MKTFQERDKKYFVLSAKADDLIGIFCVKDFKFKEV